jgi:K+ transporter
MKATLFIISFLVAFLLFAVQPMSTKMVLPVLGGTPAVWNTVMFTFQLLLLGGYIYAHLVSRLARLLFSLVSSSP